MKYTIKECTRNNLCVDCDYAECQLAGKAISDCPKWRCDDSIGDCDTCEFMKEYQEKMRAEYQKGSDNNDNS